MIFTFLKLRGSAIMFGCKWVWNIVHIDASALNVHVYLVLEMFIHIYWVFKTLMHVY